MAEEKTYSLNGLEGIKKDIEQVLKYTVEEELKLRRSLIYYLRLNIHRIEESQDIIREDFEDDNEDYLEFIKERFALIERHGGKIKQREDGNIEVTNFKEISEKEDFKVELEALLEESDGAIKKQNEILQKNSELAMKKIAVVDWKLTPLSKFPEELLATHFPTSFVEFVVDDEAED